MVRLVLGVFQRMLVTANLFCCPSKLNTIQKRKENALNEQSLQNQLHISQVFHVNQKQLKVGHIVKMNQASLHILLTLLAFFFIHRGDPQLMTGLNKKALLLLFSLFCHLCHQNISGAHQVLGVFTFLCLILTATLKVGIFILILLYRKELKIIDQDKWPQGRTPQ